MASSAKRQRRARRLAALLAFAFSVPLAAGTAVSGAASGGSGTGSAVAPGAPKISSTICLTQCVGLDRATVGSTVQVSGLNMAAAQTISFRAKQAGKRLVAPVIAATTASAQAVVPKGARNGPLRVRDSYGQKSEPGKDKLLVKPRASLRSGGPVHLADADVSPRKLFFGGSRTATLNYLIASGQPSNDLRIDVVTGAGQVVQSFLPSAVAPHVTQSIAWNGVGLDGKPVASGWYAFRISSADGQSLARAASASAAKLGVAVFSAIFPVRGPHSFGTAADGFGAARSGHTHQGQDILASCGTPIVAAIGGTVQYAGYQGAAGNYIVIDQKGSGEDNMYAHLAAPSPLHTGDRVATGQQIGVVGATGDATGCHLHFEVWTAPGWYEGGHPYDPLPLLKAWDAYS